MNNDGRNIPQHKQRQYNYNKKLLDNMSTIVNYIETSRQDLLAAVKTLLMAYKNEFEQNQLLQDDLIKLKQDNSIIEMSRNKVETDLLRIREAYNREVHKCDGLCRSIKIIQDKLKELYDELKQSDCDFGQRRLCSLINYLDCASQSSFQTFKVKDCPPVTPPSHNPVNSPNQVGTDSGSSSIMVTPEIVSAKDIVRNKISTQSHTSRSSNNREHDFELVKNRLRFHNCQLCQSSILPLMTYYCCSKCDAQIDKTCFNKKVMFCCVRKVSRTIVLEQMVAQSGIRMVPAILVKCCEEIELRASQCRSVYQEKCDKESSKILDKFLLESDASQIKCHKQSVSILCSIVKEFLKRLEDPLIQSNKWNDFARVCDQQNEQDRTPMLQFLVGELKPWNRQTLSYMMLHLYKLLAKNNCSNLNMELLINIFSSLIVRGVNVKSPSKHDQVKLINIQKQILSSLVNLTKDFWLKIFDSESGVRGNWELERRKTTSYGHILAANQRRMSICDQINNSIY